jgi:hypothetical protein
VTLAEVAAQMRANHDSNWGGDRPTPQHVGDFCAQLLEADPEFRAGPAAIADLRALRATLLEYLGDPRLLDPTPAETQTFIARVHALIIPPSTPARAVAESEPDSVSASPGVAQPDSAEKRAGAVPVESHTHRVRVYSDPETGYTDVDMVCSDPGSCPLTAARRRIDAVGTVARWGIEELLVARLTGMTSSETGRLEWLREHLPDVYEIVVRVPR